MGCPAERIHASAAISLSAVASTYSFKPAYKGNWRFVASYSGGVNGATTYASSRSSVGTVKVK